MSTAVDISKAPDRVYQRLRGELETRAFKPGDRLPTVRQLAKRFEVSIGAVHSAIARLRHDQLVVARHGSGVYVADLSTRTRNVLLLNHAAGHVWSDLTQAFMERLSSEVNIRLIVETVPAHQPEQLALFRTKLRAILDGGVDAVLFNGGRGAGPELILGDLPEQTPKLCFFSRHAITPANVGGVVSDWYHGGYAGVKHLIEMGCRHIVQVVSHPGIGGEIHELLRGGECAVADGPTGVHRAVHSIHLPPPSYDAQVEAMLRAHPKVDGVLTHADHAAAPMVAVLQRLGRRVPDDVAVVGYYDTPWTQAVSPELSSVSTRCREIAAATVDMFLAGEFYEQKVIHPRVVVRGSSNRNGKTH